MFLPESDGIYMLIEISNVVVQCDSCGGAYRTAVTDFNLTNTHPEGGSKFTKSVTIDCSCSKKIILKIDVREYGGKVIDYEQSVVGGKLRQLFGLKII